MEKVVLASESLFQPANGVPSTRLLVEIHNNLRFTRDKFYKFLLKINCLFKLFAHLKTKFSLKTSRARLKFRNYYNMSQNLIGNADMPYKPSLRGSDIAINQNFPNINIIF